MRRHASVLLLGLWPSLPRRTPRRDKEDKVDGYLEWRQGDLLIADGQKVALRLNHKFKGKGEAKDVASIPMGYELKAKGLREAGACSSLVSSRPSRTGRRSSRAT